MSNDVCKFHGNFTDLIPAGFKFQKLYLSNYRQYCYDININDKIRVWQADGGTVEVLNMSTYATKSLYAFIKNHGLDKLKHVIKPNKIFPTGNTYYRWVINNFTQEIEPFDMETHDEILASFTLRDNEYDENYITFIIDNMYAKYSKRVHGQKEIDAILMMVDKGFVMP